MWENTISTYTKEKSKHIWDSFTVLNSNIVSLIYCYITAPDIKGADIIAQTIVDVDQDGKTFVWEKNGIEIDIPP